MLKKSVILLGIFLSACTATKETIVPGIVPNSTKEKQIIKVVPTTTNIIGAVERIYLPPMKSAFQARIDTGATTSAIDAESIKLFERDGQKWAAFTIINRDTNERHTYEKPLSKRVKIKRAGDEEHRLVVEMDVKMGGETFKADFSIAEREKFDYQALIGRNILSGRAIVDVSIENTLK